MAVPSTASEADRAIAVVLIDDDIIFRTGLRVWLGQQDDVTVVGEADRQRSAMALIESVDTDSKENSDKTVPILVVVVGLGLKQSVDNGYGGLQLCRALRDRFAEIPLLVVGDPIPVSVLEQVQQAGAQSYGLKSENPTELLRRLRRLAAGEDVWPVDGILISQTVQDVKTGGTKRAIASPLTIFKRNVRLSGTRQIEATMADLLSQLENPGVLGIDRLVIEGRCRELRTARWLVQWLLATVEFDDEQTPERDTDAFINRQGRTQSVSPSQRYPGARSTSVAKLSPRFAADAADGAIISAGVEATLFDGVTLKLQSSLQNLSDVPLEIDILREDKKRELLYLIVRKLIMLLSKLRQSQVTPRQVLDGRSRILQDLWQSIADDFFGRYYAVQLEDLEIEIVTVLHDDAKFAQAEILDCIPYMNELLAHLLFQDTLMVDSVPYAAGTPEAMMRAEVLLDNAIIQIANSIIQPLLNRLGDVEVIKQGFYDRRLMSSRDVAQFRNNLSWRYRFDRTIGNPVNVFESRYRLFVLQGNGIKQTLIYAPRRDELDVLQGFPFLVTLALECRDAVAPRVRAVISFVGSGLIYVLTEVIGRGIGLVVRGVIKGIGSAWQDARFSRDAGQR